MPPHAAGCGCAYHATGQLSKAHKMAVRDGVRAVACTDEWHNRMAKVAGNHASSAAHAPGKCGHFGSTAEGVARAHARGAYKKGPTSLEFALQMLLESAGLEFEAQVQFGTCVVDAWVPSHGLVFEADGMFWYHHQDKAREARRDAYLMRQGVTAVVHLVDEDLESWT